MYAGMTYNDTVFKEAIRYARTPIERSFGGLAWSPQRRGVLTITHRLAHLIVRAERDRQYWTMVGAKYFLMQLDRAIGHGPHPDATLQAFRTRLQEIIAKHEASYGEWDISELEILVATSGNTSDRILVGPTFENSGSFTGPSNIERKLSSFVDIYMWDQIS